MKIGFAKRCITPKLPIRLAGYAGIRIAQEVLDDLFVRVIVFQKDQEVYGVLTFDLCAVDDLMIKQIKEGMKQYHLHGDHFLFVSTHTHSGPGGNLETSQGILQAATDIFLKPDPALIRDITKQALSAVKDALDHCQKTSLTYAKSTLHQVGNNRNRTDFKGNDDIAVLFLKQEDGNQAVLLNFACHPTIMNGKNQKISADFPGAIERCMMQHGYDMSMYINGSCGDISTRFSRQSSEPSELMRYGRMFEEKLLDMHQQAKEIVLEDITVEHKTFAMQLKKADSIEDAQAKLEACIKRYEEAKQQGISGSELRVLESYKEGAEANLRLANHAFQETVYEVPLMFVKINDHALVCVPGELFSELSNPLQNEHVHFIGYANGYLGYFADEHAYDHLYYEALSSPFQKGQSEKMMAFIQTQIDKMLGKEQ